MGRHRKQRIKQKRRDGTLLPYNEYVAQSWRNSEAEFQQRRQKLETLLNDTSISVSADLTKQALEQDASLTPGMWEYAFGFACKADELMQKEANPKIIRTIWFRGMDKYHSFDTRWWITNLNVLTINLTPPADRNAGQRAYLTAIEEARSAASTQFAAREHYIQLWMQGQGGLPAWTTGAEKHYLRLLKWSEDMLGEMERQLLQQGNEARVPAMDEKVLEQVTGQMNDVGKMVREEFNAGDLARKMEVLQIVGAAKGVEGAFGI